MLLSSEEQLLLTIGFVLFRLFVCVGGGGGSFPLDVLLVETLVSVSVSIDYKQFNKVHKFQHLHRSIVAVQ